jgi:predicted GIY-YIG superfamily endonuclease
MRQDLTTLYRYFDAGKRLLYVGISNNAVQRLAQHLRDAKWARAIASVEMEHFSTRRQAIYEEVRAIETEKPLWNVLHNLKKAALREHATNKRKRKFRPEELMFDYGNVARNIQATRLMVEQIMGLAVAARIEGYPECERFISLRLKMGKPLVGKDVGLDQLFDAPIPRPTPCSGFLMITGVPVCAPGEIVEQVEITLITPRGLEESCRESLSKSELYAAVYPCEVLPAINEFKGMYLDIERWSSVSTF